MKACSCAEHDRVQIRLQCIRTLRLEITQKPFIVIMALNPKPSTVFGPDSFKIRSLGAFGKGRCLGLRDPQTLSIPQTLNRSHPRILRITEHCPTSLRMSWTLPICKPFIVPPKSLNRDSESPKPNKTFNLNLNRGERHALTIQTSSIPETFRPLPRKPWTGKCVNLDNPTLNLNASTPNF